MFETRSELEQLLAVADEGRIVAAAERLAMTQPALTRAIAKLERRAGGALFERLPSGVRLTALGTVAVERARRLVREFEDTDEHIGEAVAGRDGRLRVSAAPLWMRAVVAPATLRFQTEHPDVGLTVSPCAPRPSPKAYACSWTARARCTAAASTTDGRCPRSCAASRCSRSPPASSPGATTRSTARAPPPATSCTTPGSTATPRRAPRPARAGLRSPRSSNGCASARASTPDRCSARARRASASSPRGPWLSWLPFAFLARLPALGLGPLPLTFGRRRYPSGLVARRSAEDLAPVRKFEGIVRTIALERPE